jgi:signal transduction histidine kinase
VDAKSLDSTEDDLKALDTGRELLAYRRQALRWLLYCASFCVALGAFLFRDVADLRLGLAILCAITFSATALAHAKKDLPASLMLAAMLLSVPPYFSIHGLGIFDSTIIVIPAGMFAMSIIFPRDRLTWTYLAAALASAFYIFWETLEGRIAFPREQARVVSDGVLTLAILSFSMFTSGWVGRLLSRMFDKVEQSQLLLSTEVAARTAELERSNDELREALSKLSEAGNSIARADKLASLGGMVAGVAHELNTPLGNARLALSSLCESIDSFRPKIAGPSLSKNALLRFFDDAGALSKLALGANTKAADLVASFKSVSVDQASQRRRHFFVHEVVHDMLATLGPSRKGTPWEVESLVPEGIAMDSFPGPLGQVVANLVENALLHGLSGREFGRVEIGACRHDGFVELWVQDDGRGMDEDTRARAFDPFFTTRQGLGGSGLGLTVSHNLVATVLGGTLSCESEPGRGTKFTAKIPSIAANAPPSSTEARADS